MNGENQYFILESIKCTQWCLGTGKLHFYFNVMEKYLNHNIKFQSPLHVLRHCLLLWSIRHEKSIPASLERQLHCYLLTLIFAVCVCVFKVLQTFWETDVQIWKSRTLTKFSSPQLKSLPYKMYEFILLLAVCFWAGAQAHTWELMLEPTDQRMEKSIEPNAPGSHSPRLIYSVLFPSPPSASGLEGTKHDSVSLLL